MREAILINSTAWVRSILRGRATSEGGGGLSPSGFARWSIPEGCQLVECVRSSAYSEGIFPPSARSFTDHPEVSSQTGITH